MSSLSLPPFSVPNVSLFNSLVGNEVGNSLISGAIITFILIQLSLICNTLIQFSPKHHLLLKSFDRHQIFSRLSQFRNLGSLFKIHDYHAFNPSLDDTPQYSQLHYSRMIFPFFVFLCLFAAEFATILAGTSRRHVFLSHSNFDPVLAVPTKKPAPRRNASSSCENFFISSRGVLQEGHVLKCIKQTSQSRTFEATDSIIAAVNYEENSLLFSVTSIDIVDAFHISVKIRSIDGGSFETMPFRLERNDQTNPLHDSVINGVRKKLHYHPLQKPEWKKQIFFNQNGGGRRVIYSHTHNITLPHQDISASLLSEMQNLELVLNSSGPPWVFSQESKYETRKNLVMAITGARRVPHGVLLIILVVTFVTQTFLCRFCGEFEKNSYIAIKEIIGDDCVLGPLAGNRRTISRSVQVSELVEGSM